jgi:hypothetical protein
MRIGNRRQRQEVFTALTSTAIAVAPKVGQASRNLNSLEIAGRH